MNPYLTLGLILAYFGILIAISFFTGRNTDNRTFFTGARNTPWYIIAFGMIGTSISGVTFISVPGAVGPGGFGYFQVVMGYLLGYAVIGTVLLPLYYRLNLTSIYQYLDTRFGNAAYKTGASFFLVSRLLGSSLRLYLVALVLQLAVFDYFGLPFWLTVLASVGLIYVYTFRSGVQTVIWTDTAQTVGLLAGVVISIVFIARSLHLDMGHLLSSVSTSSHSSVFFWDWHEKNYFWKHFLGGAAITIAMTGLDQDMMQKNLACRSLRDAQKNMFWFSLTLVGVNLLFLSLGALLYRYGNDMGAIQEGMVKGKFQLLFRDAATGIFAPIRTDQLFPKLAFQYLGAGAALTFILGVIAAAYSSADSAMTALTTSFCVDILGVDPQATGHEATRMRTHVGFAFAMFLTIIIFHNMNDAAVIDKVLDVAGYTYGPLMGLYAFGLFTERGLRAAWVPVICILAPALTYAIAQEASALLGYKFGFELMLLNAGLTLAGLFGISTRAVSVA